MQQQEVQQDEAKRREEYAQAQRVAVESVLIGRSVAESVHQQGEQLKRADMLADDTQFKLDKAGRLLKGMTWGGWVTNMFTPDVRAPKELASLDKPRTADGLPSFKTYEKLPPVCQAAAQSIQNYHANVTVLMQCETEEQKETCIQICDSMYTVAKKRIEEDLQSLEAYSIQLQSDLEAIRQRQLINQSQVRGLVDRVGALSLSGNTEQEEKEKEKLFGRKPESGTKLSPAKKHVSPALSRQHQEQDEHLEILSTSLGELGHIAKSLNVGFHEQQQTIDSLDTKSENLLETSKMVGRRADRIIQKKSWSPVKPVYCCRIAIRHVESGKFLSVLGTELFLATKFHPANSVFNLHKRQGNIFGLQNEGTRKWVGQSWVTGTLTCSSSTFGRREEWQADEINDWKFNVDSNLLCTSAGWGQGAYLQINEQSAVQIGSPTIESSRTAAKWSLINRDSQE